MPALGIVLVASGHALTVTGPARDDSFPFGKQPFTGSDRVVGGAGADSLVLEGAFHLLARAGAAFTRSPFEQRGFTLT